MFSALSARPYTFPMVFTFERGDMDGINLTFRWQNTVLRACLRHGRTWFALPDLCAALGRVSVGEAAAFLTGVEPPQWNVSADLFAGDIAVSEEGLWTVVSLAGYELHEDPARWLHRDVMTAMRRSAFEARPSEDSPAARELWYIYRQLADRGDLVNFTDAPGELAIHCGDLRIAAMRRGYAVPSQSKTVALLKGSRSPLFLGKREINYLGRHVHCYAFSVDG